MKKTLALIVLAALLVLTFTSCGANYNFDLNEYITLPGYKGIEVSKAEIADDLKAAIDQLITNATTTEQITDRAVKDGDKVNVDFAGYLDGEIYTEGDQSTSDSGINVIVGSGAMIDGFESSMIGHKGGDIYSVDLTFPEDYENSEALRGKTLTFEITINFINEETVPAYDDALVSSATTYATVAEYEQKMTENLRKDHIWQAILDGTKVEKYPEKNVKQYYDNSVDSYKYYASTYNMSLDNFISAYFGYDAQTFLASTLEYAKEQVKNEMVFNLIAKNEGIEVTKAEYDARIDDYVKEYGAESRSALESQYSKDAIKSSMLYEMVVEAVTAAAVDVD